MTSLRQLGNGALALACFGGHLEIVKKLVSLGLPVSEINQVNALIVCSNLFSLLYRMAIHLCTLQLTVGMLKWSYC